MPASTATRRASARISAPERAPSSAALEDLVSEAMVFLHAAARRQGLTLLQLVALRMVAQTGSLSPSDLAEKLGVSRPAVTSSINTLEAGGWVVRSHPSGDRRRLRATLTPRAQRALRDLASERRRFLEVGLSAISAADREVFVRALCEVVGRLREDSTGMEAHSGGS